MPKNAVYVGRPTKWGNPFAADGSIDDGDRYVLVEYYRDYVTAAIRSGMLSLEPLRGKDLACWCRHDQPCHADVLLELANK